MNDMNPYRDIGCCASQHDNLRAEPPKPFFPRVINQEPTKVLRGQTSKAFRRTLLAKAARSSD